MALPVELAASIEPGDSGQPTRQDSGDNGDAEMPEGAVDHAEALGTKTLAQLREEAINERRDLLVSLMPARGHLLAELHYLHRDRAQCHVFGSGLDSSSPAGDPSKRLVHDPDADKALVAFTEQWMQDPRLASRIKVSDVPLPRSSPPPSPVRRDSNAGDMSEEVAAIERELIKPEYRRTPGEIIDGAGADQDGRRSTSVPGPGEPDLGEGSSRGHRPDALSAEGYYGSSSRDSTHVAPERPASNRPPRHRRTSSVASPFPVTFRASSTGSVSHHPSQTILEAPLAQPLTIDPSQLLLQPQQDPSSGGGSSFKRADGRNDISAARIPSYPIPYPPALPALPSLVVKNRLMIGGLAKKKARERHAAAQQASHGTVAGAVTPLPLGPSNADLYKLGVSKAVHSGVRSLMGVGAPQAGKTRTGSKTLLSSDWNVALSELQTFKALERIEQLKSEKSWSFRQIKKQRAPGINKSHWDYLLDEMKWLAIDYKQETRWKIATAFQVVRDVAEWHAADDEGKQALRVKRRPIVHLDPSIHEIPSSEEKKTGSDLVTEDIAMDTAPAANESAAEVEVAVATVEEEARPSSIGEAESSHTLPDAQQDEQNEQHAQSKAPPPSHGQPAAETPAQTPTSQTPTSKALQLPNSSGTTASEPPRARRFQHATNRARAHIFDLPLDRTVHHLAVATPDSPPETSPDLPDFILPLPHVYNDTSVFDTVNELFQELPLYQPPAAPHPDPRQNRRIDEASPNYARITNPSYLLEGKPLLVSTLNPAKRRKRNGEWSDMLELAGDEGRETMLDLFTTGSDLSLSSGTSKPKDGNKRLQPAPPANAEVRASMFDWTAEEDRQLYVFARQYSYNWDLVSHVFNSVTKKGHLKGDERLPWDCFDRWNKKFGQPPAPQSGSSGSSTSNANGATASSVPAAGPENGSMQTSKNRRTSTASSQPPSAGLQSSTGPAAGALVVAAAPTPAAKKPEVSKAQLRHTLMVEATRKSQNRRAAQQKAQLPPAVRKVSLNAHESHNQSYYPGLSALDLSKLKAERERQHLEEIRKREQTKMYQQAQAAAMAQQQLMQLQAQGQPIPPQLQMQAQQRNGIPMQPNVRMPQQALPPNLQANQAALVQAQRAAGQLPPNMQIQAGQVRQMPQQHIQRPPSQQSMVGGVAGQQPHPQMNGQIQSSPPPGFPAGMHMPAQNRTGSPQGAAHSPQNSQIQLSPQMQVQLQLQQAAAAAAAAAAAQHQQGGVGVGAGGPMAQLTPAQQQAFMMQLAQVQAQRNGSPNMAGGIVGLPGGFAVPPPNPQQQQGGHPQQQHQQMPQIPGATLEQQQQILNMMRMRQNSQASQNSVQ